MPKVDFQPQEPQPVILETPGKDLSDFLGSNFVDGKLNAVSLDQAIGGY